MVDLEGETPYFYRTYDKFDDLNQARISFGFGGSVWKCEVIRSFSIGESHLIFDPPEEWGEGLPPVRFYRTANGRYQHRSEGMAYDAVRADTKTRVVLTGRWAETTFGKGVFIAVFPIKLSEVLLLEDAAKLPVETDVTAMVAHP